MTHEEMGEEVHCPKTGPMASQRRQFISRLSNPTAAVGVLPPKNAYDAVVSLANVKNPTSGPQIVVSRNIYDSTGLYSMRGRRSLGSRRCTRNSVREI